jgi:HPt (histidine-containing phosphotransfer) domain-containing protein
MARTFDETELLERVDNDLPFLGETVEMLCSDGPSLMAEVQRALAANDAAAIGRSAHALKGMISNFCAKSAQERALDLERIGKSGDLAQAPAAAQALQEHLEGLIGELREFMKART